VYVSRAERRAGNTHPDDGLQIRIARPTDTLDAVVMFYRDAVGLPVIRHFEGHAGYAGVMLGVPNTRCHLEFTHADAGSPCPAPSKDNLLVFYLPNSERYLSALQRMTHHGHSPVEPDNPYWKGKSQTFEDPDGWRVVLYNGDPFPGS
jgi:catechol 2,3-dioxygenase-like lactoylglutathione lyase family enzyme